jgi:hypothetical protein
MKLGNMNSIDMAQFFIMMFTIMQKKRAQILKSVASKQEEANRLRNEIAINEKILEDECVNYMDEQEARSDLMYCNSALERIENFLDSTKDIQTKFNTIEKIKAQYVATIQESVRKKTEQLATKQENLLSEFNNMCASGISMSDFHACQKLFTQYNQTLRNLQKLKKQRIK